jgi:CBS domain-containing protein
MGHGPATAPMSLPASSAHLLHFSLLTGGTLREPQGRKVGRISDLTVLLQDRRAPVSGALARIGDREVYVPASELAELGYGGVRLERAAAADLAPFEQREDELRLAKDVLDHKLIDINSRRLVRANEIELLEIDGWYEVVGIDTSLRGFLRRLLPRRLAHLIPARGFRDWANLEPLTADLAQRAGTRLRRLHPAELADLVEEAAHNDGEEIIEAAHRDPALEANLFEELDQQHRLEFLRRRSNSEVAHVLSRMEPDVTVDLIQSLPKNRRLNLLALLPPLQRREIRDLLDYPPTTAGGLMTPQFICLYADTTKTDALQRLDGSPLPAHVMATLYVMNQRRRLAGAIPLPDLLRGAPDQRLGEIAPPAPTRVKADADLEELARLMSDYNLTILPVVDNQEHMIGIVTVDDVLALLLPKRWRRRFDILGGP